MLSAAAPTSLDPYGQLFKMLMPRACNLAVYGREGTALWLAEAGENSEIRALVEQVLARAGTSGTPGELRDLDGESAYVFLLRDERGHCLGATALSCSERGGQTRSFEAARSLLRPALEVLSRELANQYNIGGLQKDLSDRDGDLELLLGGPNGDQKEDADDFGLVLQKCIAHLGCPIGALLIPDKNIAVCRTAGIAAQSGADALTRTHRHLLALAQVQRRTIVLNRSANSGPMAGLPYKILACPVMHSGQRVVGVLVIFKHARDHDFDLRQIHVVELLARRINHVLQNAFDATGLLTRPAFEKRALAALAAASKKASHCVIYADVDRLHVLNENMGMHIGDEIITRVAETLRSALNPRTMASRISGDRFAIFLPDTELDEARAFAEDLCRRINQQNVVVGGKRVEISASFGVAHLEPSEHPISHALAGAEAACKAAKDRGRNRVEALEDADRSIVRRVEDVALLGAVREALELGRFKMDAQPMVALHGHGERHFELLLRMLDAKGQVLTPDRFLLAAERYQLAPAIDRWVLQSVLDIVSAAAPKLQSLGAQFAINISGQSLGDDEFTGFLERTLRTYALPPSLISFELTETAAVSNIVRAEALMRKLRDLGHEIALDDFGRGLSSLTYLKSLPVTCVKLDGELVRDVAGNPRSQAMVNAVVQLARAMRLKTTAECVENEEILHALRELDVDYVQGFAIGRPRPFELVLKELLSNEATHVPLRNDY